MRESVCNPRKDRPGGTIWWHKLPRVGLGRPGGSQRVSGLEDTQLSVRGAQSAVEQGVWKSGHAAPSCSLSAWSPFPLSQAQHFSGQLLTSLESECTLTVALVTRRGSWYQPKSKVNLVLEEPSVCILKKEKKKPKTHL